MLFRSVSPAAPSPTTVLAVMVDVYPDRVVTAPPALPVGSTVALTVRNHTQAPVRLALSGYEDRVSARSIAPDTSWRDTFLAYRPGEQLAWLVNGEPAGRFDIRGSHLEKGHR